MFARTWFARACAPSARLVPVLGLAALAATVLAAPLAHAQATAPQAAEAPNAGAPKPGLDKNGLPTSVIKVSAPPQDPDAVAPPRTEGPVDEIIITAPQFGSREEVEAFHKAEFERLDKLYGKHEEKRSRGDTLTKSPESNTGTTRDGPITLDR
ncbi:hypothetical protein [Nitrospirillum iridis]|uniref:hypothetical protein n=1 Tax=Nitrospirillum iridis TaxID=765888 RepID=UPI001B3C114F|nr:hypothetical protein [Nitrospirillum iridis]